MNSKRHLNVINILVSEGHFKSEVPHGLSAEGLNVWTST